MATETELLRATILALGGSCDDLPDNLESTLYKRLIEVCASAGGGGGSGGGGGVFFCQMVVDAGGSNPMLTAYKDKECITQMSFGEAIGMLDSGPVSLKVFAEEEGNSLVIYLQPSAFEVVQEAHAFLATVVLNGMPMQLPLIFGDSILG